MASPEAEELNRIINENSPVVLELLSLRGKGIFFPKKGILAQSAEAKGKKINATIGIALEEDNSPMRLKSIADNIKLNPKDIFPYAPSFGRQDIREEWKKLIYKKNPSLKDIEFSLPIVTNAITHGLSMIGYLFIDNDNTIITPDLFWGNYKLIFINAYGAKLLTFPLFEKNGFNIEGLRKSLLSEGDKKVLLLNFPNNPTGYSPTVEEMGKIADAIKESADSGKKVLVIIDDAYFGLVYEKGIAVESIFTKISNLHKNVLAVKLDGATKEDYVWGFRVGFISYGIKDGKKELYNALEGKTAGAVRGNISNASNLSQSLILKAITSPYYWKEKSEKHNILKRRYESVKETLAKNAEYTKYFEALPYNSGYFMCLKLKYGIDAEKVRRLLLDKYSTGVISTGNNLRIAFSATPLSQIDELFRNIYNACKELVS